MNKVLVNLYVPKIDGKFEVFIPVNKNIATVIKICSKIISELTNQTFPLNSANELFNKKTGDKYDINVIVKNTDIRNGIELILL